MTRKMDKEESPEKTSEDSKNKEHNPPMNAKEEWYEFLKTGLIAILLAVAIRTFLLEPFNIPSGSMKPTLEIGDYLFVYKPSYGYSRFSFPFGMAPIDGRMWSKEPKRGDVIVFKLPVNTNVDYIKRLIGMPGDTVQVINGRLYINNKLVPREKVGVKKVDDGPIYTEMTEYIETLPGGVRHRIYEESDTMPLDDTPAYTVPEGHYFLMGDNRDNSQDSRVMDKNGVGFVPYRNLVGRADMIFFSTNGTAKLIEIWKWPWTIRYNRLFNIISKIHPSENTYIDEKKETNGK